MKNPLHVTYPIRWEGQWKGGPWRISAPRAQILRSESIQPSARRHARWKQRKERRQKK